MQHPSTKDASTLTTTTHLLGTLVQFALSRKQTSKGPAAPSSAPANPVPVSTPTLSTASTIGLNHALHTVSPAFMTDIAHNGNQSAASASLAASAAVAPAGVQQLTETPTMDVTAADQRRIHEENSQLLQSMSSAEVCTITALYLMKCLT